MLLKDVAVKTETMKITTTNHLIRKEYLNHHDTLYAGRGAEWLIETAYMAAVDTLQTNSVVPREDRRSELPRSCTCWRSTADGR